MNGIKYEAYRTSRPQILDLRFARYAKYCWYYTRMVIAKHGWEVARHANILCTIQSK